MRHHLSSTAPSFPLALLKIRQYVYYSNMLLYFEVPKPNPQMQIMMGGNHENLPVAIDSRGARR
jgi:hypothetical protein